MAKHNNSEKEIFTNFRCPICGAPRHQLARLCKRCKKLVDRIDPRHKVDREARIKALKLAWDRNEKVFRCYYTRVTLVLNNHHHPLHLTFDHRTPKDKRDIVVAAACINDMKTDLSEDEFHRIVLELAQHFRGEQFDEGVLNLKHWRR